MALEVEDGTGKANADSYNSLVEFRAYAAARGIEGPATATDTDCEAALRKAFDYVNTSRRYKSAPKSNDQAGEFPRVDLSDGMGRVFNDTVPARVKAAHNEAAILSLAGEDLYQNLDRGGQVQSESVGPISTTYFAGAPAGKLFEAINGFLTPFVRRDDCPEEPLPSYNDYSGDDDRPDPIFTVGMDDNTTGNG